MTFMEWLQDTLDFTTIDSLVIENDTLFVTPRCGKEAECKDHISFIIRQSKIQLTPESFSEVMAPWIKNIIKDPNTQMICREVIQRLNVKREVENLSGKRTEAKPDTNDATVQLTYGLGGTLNLQACQEEDITRRTTNKNQEHPPNDGFSNSFLLIG